MARSVCIALPREKADTLLDRLKTVRGVAGLALERGSSIDPPGDIVTVQITNDGLRDLMRTLADLDITQDGSVSISQLAGLIAPGHQKAVDEEGDTLPWEEAMTQLQETSNATPNYILLMMLSGGLAAIAFWNDQLLPLLAAQLIGPHFEVLLRVPLGIVVRSRAMVGRGLMAIVAGYAALALSAALSFWLLRFIDPTHESDLHTRALAHQFSTLATTAPLQAILASAAGAAIILSRRTILLSGVYIALALVPGMALCGVALAAGDWTLALHALKRWSLDAGAIFVIGGAIFGLAQVMVEKRMALNQIALRKG